MILVSPPIIDLTDDESAIQTESSSASAWNPPTAKRTNLGPEGTQAVQENCKAIISLHDVYEGPGYFLSLVKHLSFSGRGSSSG